MKGWVTVVLVFVFLLAPHGDTIDLSRGKYLEEVSVL